MVEIRSPFLSTDSVEFHRRWNQMRVVGETSSNADDVSTGEIHHDRLQCHSNDNDNASSANSLNQHGRRNSIVDLANDLNRPCPPGTNPDFVSSVDRTSEETFPVMFPLSSPSPIGPQPTSHAPSTASSISNEERETSSSLTDSIVRMAQELGDAVASMDETGNSATVVSMGRIRNLPISPNDHQTLDPISGIHITEQQQRQQQQQQSSYEAINNSTSTNSTSHDIRFPPAKSEMVDNNGNNDDTVPLVTAIPVPIDDDPRYPPRRSNVPYNHSGGCIYDTNGNVDRGFSSTVDAVRVVDDTNNGSPTEPMQQTTSCLPSDVEQVLFDEQPRSTSRTHTTPTTANAASPSAQREATLHETDSPYHPQTSLRKFIWQTNRVAKAGCRKAHPHIQKAAHNIRHVTYQTGQETKREIQRYSRATIVHTKDQISRANSTVQLVMREHVGPTIVDIAGSAASATKRTSQHFRAKGKVNKSNV